MNPERQTLAEAMALQVLKGNYEAAARLAEAVLAERMTDGLYIPPLKTIVHSVRVENIRATFHTYPSLGGDVEIDVPALEAAFKHWVEGGPLLILVGMWMDLYQLPDSWARKSASE